MCGVRGAGGGGGEEEERLMRLDTGAVLEGRCGEFDGTVSERGFK